MAFDGGVWVHRTRSLPTGNNNLWICPAVFLDKDRAEADHHLTNGSTRRLRVRRWWAALSLVTALGFGIRFGTVLGRLHRAPVGDAFYYHYAANLLVSGRGFIDPWWAFYPPHRVVQTAAWPPLFVFALSFASFIGLKSFLAHRIWCCLIGSAAVVASGILGRKVAGPRAGVIAAALVALYPNLWMADELALSECLSALLITLSLLAVYRFWRRPGYRSMVLVGIVIGLSALARDELILLVPLILVPLGLLVRQSWRRRIASLAVGTVTSLAVVAPWVGYNMSRFQNPVLISDGLGVTLASANCDDTWSGSFEGYWSYACAVFTPTNVKADESIRAAQAESYALRYVRTHENRLVPVEFARLGRAFGAFHPMGQIERDSAIETRPYHWALVGLAAYYLLVVLAVGGTVILRRRGVPVFPLWAVGLDVAIAVLLTFGQTRYRTTFEICLTLLAAVQLDWLWNRCRKHQRQRRLTKDLASFREPLFVRLPEFTSADCVAYNEIYGDSNQSSRLPAMAGAAQSDER